MGVQVKITVLPTYVCVLIVPLGTIIIGNDVNVILKVAVMTHATPVHMTDGDNKDKEVDTTVRFPDVIVLVFPGRLLKLKFRLDPIEVGVHKKDNIFLLI